MGDLVKSGTAQSYREKQLYYNFNSEMYVPQKAVVLSFTVLSLKRPLNWNMGDFVKWNITCTETHITWNIKYQQFGNICLMSKIVLWLNTLPSWHAVDFVTIISWMILSNQPLHRNSMIWPNQGLTFWDITCTKRRSL